MAADINRMARSLSADSRLTRTDVDQIIRSAKDGRGVTANENNALKRILTRYDSKFEPDAKRALQEFLGLGGLPGNPGQPASGAVSQRASSVKELGAVGDTFLAEVQARKAELVDEKQMYGLFQDYVGALNRVKGSGNETRVKFEQEKLMKAYESLDSSAYGKIDEDKDGLGRAAEHIHGTDAAIADTDADGVTDGKEIKAGSNALDKKGYSWMAERKAWNDTNYWPMAGEGGLATGVASHNMWASSGPLDKLDQLAEKRTGKKGEALTYERKSALNWLVNEKGGSFVPYQTILESDAERTTGVDFDRDGKITAGVRADFLDRRGNFVPAAQWDAYLGSVKLNRKETAGANGQKTVEYTRPDGSRLSAEEKTRVHLAPVRNGVKGADGQLDGTLNVGWWGRCDGMAHVGTVFTEPKRDVTINGVTFTQNDIKGLLGIMAESLAGPSNTNDAWVGARFDDQPEILSTKDGKQIYGKLLTEGVEFRTPETWTHSGDYMVLQSLKNTPKEKLDARLDGQPVERSFGAWIKADGKTLSAAEAGKLEYGITFEGLDGKTQFVPMSNVAQLAKEDVEDVVPAAFHETLQRWIGAQGTGAVMDSYAAGQVWNYNYWKADVRESEPGFKPAKPGVSGMPKPDNKVQRYDMDLHFGKQDEPKPYSYWIEYDKTSGKPVNSGWISENPDFLWRHPKDAPVSWNGALERNPYVDLKLLQEIYEKSIN